MNHGVCSNGLNFLYIVKLKRFRQIRIYADTSVVIGCLGFQGPCVSCSKHSFVCFCWIWSLSSQNEETIPPFDEYTNVVIMVCIKGAQSNIGY